MQPIEWIKMTPSKLWPLATISVVFCLTLVLAIDVRAQQIEGFSQPYRIAKLAASTSGILRDRHVSEGQQVKKGQPLLSLDSSVTEMALQIARATVDAKGEYAATEAEYKLREERLLALRELKVRGHATDDELRRAETEYELAAAHLQTVKERRHIRELECAKLEAELATYCVRAPFDGVVTKIYKTAGEYVGPGDVAVCTIAELTTLTAEFLVPRDLAQRYEIGSSASTHFLESNVVAAGEVCYVSPFPEGETGMFFVRVRVDNQHGLLSAGERCLLLPGQFPTAERQATRSPASHSRKGTVSQ